MAILFTQSSDWEDNPGAYEFIATIAGGIVLNIAGEQMGDDGDMFAAFDEDENVRGVGLMLIPPFGPYEGTPVFEVQLRSNTESDPLHFKYYDASQDAILNIAETYDFVINDVIGDVENPMIYNFVPITLSFTNVTSTGIDINYESNTEISGFQFDVDGVDVTGASGGAAGDAGFMISSSTTTVLAFSLSGATLPAGSGTLLSLEFEVSSEDQTLEVSHVIFTEPNGSSIPVSGPGSIELEPFTYSQSTLQAFYFFNLVLINDMEVTSNDWVGAFNGDVCVGSRRWDTSQCGSNICDVPVMGYDGTEYTEGYMMPGGIPTFKIYDASENLYYTAESSENSGWSSNGMLTAEILSANVSVPGCTDSNYCNYDASATEDDGSCNYLCTGCTEIGACNYSENATINDGSCYYGEENYDCAGNCIAELDCAGVCGGSVALDLCGECENYIGTNGIQPDFPYGDCDCAGVPNGDALLDNCSNCDNDSTNDCIQDCSGEWGGSLNEDNCGECDDNASNDCVKDCSGAWGGDLVIDECGVCGGPGPTSECGCSDITDGLCDCDGHELDQCGICNGNNNTCLDCAGTPNGDAVLDNCNNCDNDSTNDCIQDCTGIWGGAAVLDNCGICDNDITNDCMQDCAGIWGGTAEIDDCEICDGYGPEENYDCEGNCVAELDCDGICGGSNMPTFSCENENVACNAAGCNSLDISPYLLPDGFGINKIFPNPFNPVTHIQYELMHFGLVSIKIYDIQGRVVDQLINEYQSPGHYSLIWNASNHASGMYIVAMVMQLENNEVTRDLQKILYLK